MVFLNLARSVDEPFVMSSSIVPLPTGDDSTVNHNQGSSTITHGWRFMLLEVKLLHFKRQYRLCIRLSEELLSNLNEVISSMTSTALVHILRGFFLFLSIR